MPVRRRRKKRLVAEGRKNEFGDMATLEFGTLVREQVKQHIAASLWHTAESIKHLNEDRNQNIDGGANRGNRRDRTSFSDEERSLYRRTEGGAKISPVGIRPGIERTGGSPGNVPRCHRQRSHLLQPNFQAASRTSCHPRVQQRKLLHHGI